MALAVLCACGNKKVTSEASLQEICPARGFRTDIPLDSIRLSDPCILADKAKGMYYMTGTRGLLWKSRDLARWEGPYHVAMTDSNSWMGHRPEIWAAELHQYNGKYYYFATFTNNAVKIDTVAGNVTVYSCYLFLLSSASIRSIPFCPFLYPSLHEMFPWYLQFS